MDSARFHAAFFVLVTFLFHGRLTFAFLGINYGPIADNLPPSAKAVSFVQSVGASKVKIFDAEPSVITAFANSNIELIFGLPNEFLQQTQNPDEARAWVRKNIQPYLPATKISGFDVGNEVLTLADPVLRSSLVPAMQNIHQALVELGLEKQVIVGTIHALNILQSSYPPSSCSFRQDLMGEITGVVEFHKQTSSPFFINVILSLFTRTILNKCLLILFSLGQIAKDLKTLQRIFVMPTCFSLSLMLCTMRSLH